MKPKISRLTTQKEIESFLQTLESNDAHKKVLAAQYRQTIHDKVGMEGREGKTMDNLKQRIAAGKQEREEKRLSEEATIEKKKLRDAYLETVGKSGTTVLRNQQKWLEQLFPDDDGMMDEDEAEQYT
jgi:peptidoglycan hydrolase CwlO-like protein